ncbi:hypothetical protein ACJX0J_014020, partial [Zea mays]
ECRSKRDSPSLFSHARSIMYTLKEKGIDMVIASRSPPRTYSRLYVPDVLRITNRKHTSLGPGRHEAPRGSSHWKTIESRLEGG